MRRGLIALFARHRLLANLLMGLMFLLGGVALTRMNVQFFPTFALDVITVRVVWSGAAAEDVELGILVPLEERLKTVDGLKKLTATASQGIAALSLELWSGTDPLRALDQVRQRVDEFRNLPQDAETPQISRVSRYEPVARLLVTGPSLAELRPWVRQFERELLARGIDRVEIGGLPEERIAIEVSAAVLPTLGLALDGIGERVGKLARDLPTGEELAAHLAFQLERLAAMRQAAAQLMGRDRLGQSRFARGAPEAVARSRRTEWQAGLIDLMRAYARLKTRDEFRPYAFDRTDIYPLETALERLREMLGYRSDELALFDTRKFWQDLDQRARIIEALRQTGGFG